MIFLNYPHSTCTSLFAALSKAVHIPSAKQARKGSPWNGFPVGHKSLMFLYLYQTQLIPGGMPIATNVLGFVQVTT